MVLEDVDHWYSEDGKLSKTFCEQDDNNIKPDEQDCCSCDEAKYSVSLNKQNPFTSIHFLIHYLYCL